MDDKIQKKEVTMNNKYDVIIIGAGLGGLSAGALLAKNNKKVLIIEQHTKPGGYASNFKRKGYVFDASLHNTGPIYENAKFKDLLEELDVLDKINILPYKELTRIILPDHDFIIKNGSREFAQYLKSEFPKDTEGIDNIFKIFKDIYDEFEDINLSYSTIDKLTDDIPMLPLKFPMLVTLVDKTFNDILKDYIKNPKLKSILSSYWWVNGLPPDEMPCLLYAMSAYPFFEYTGSFIEGTAQKLSDLLLSHITNNGGTALFRQEVVSINIDSGILTGVTTNKGETFYAENIVSNANPIDTIINMIPEEEMDRRYRKKILKSELSISGLQMYIGLKHKPVDLGMECQTIEVFTNYDHRVNYETVLKGDYENTFFYITDFTPFNQDLQEKGKGSLNLFTLDHIKHWENLSKEEYKNKKKEVINIFLKRIDKLIPNLSDNIEFTELATPMTMKRYTKNPQGAIYGFSNIASQSGINRFSNETPINGLYIAGAYTYPGPGFFSCILSGTNAAKLVLKNS